MGWSDLLQAQPVVRTPYARTLRRYARQTNNWRTQRMACEETEMPTTITKGDQCTCPPASETMTVAFSAPPRLENIANLPATSGGTLEWWPGHFPTANPMRTTFSSASETTDSSSTVTPSPSLPLTSAPTNNPVPQGSNLSEAAEAGIGIGSAVGAILLFGALSALWMVFRRRRNDKNTTNSNPETGPTTGPEQNDKSSPAELPTPEVSPRPRFSELAVGPPWVVRPELQGDAAIPAPGQGNGSPPPPGPLPGSPTATGWSASSQEWGAGMAVMSGVGGERGLHQGQQGQVQGNDQWASADARQRLGQGVAVELAA